MLGAHIVPKKTYKLQHTSNVDKKKVYAKREGKQHGMNESHRTVK